VESATDANFGAWLQNATTDVITTMMGFEPDGCRVVEVSRTIDNEVVGVLGFTGTCIGTFTISCKRDTAQKLCAAMLMMEPEELTDESEIADGFGELVNMVGGNFKNEWVSAGKAMDLAIPSVNFHAAVAIPREPDRSHEGVGFSTRVAGGDLNVDVRFIHA